MPLFIYKATDSLGKVTNASVEAADETAAVTRIQELGLIPIRITVADERRKPGSIMIRNPVSVLLNRVKGKDLMLFTQDLTTLIHAGLPIDRSLSILMSVVENRTLHRILGDILKSIQEGNGLSDALARFPKTFSGFYVNMVRAGETGGALEDVLQRLGIYLESTQELKEFVKSALVYPIFLTVVSGLSIIILMVYVIPKFAVIFSDLGGQIPWSSRMLLASSEFLRGYWWAMLAGIVTSALLLNRYRRSASGRMAIDRLMLKLPFVRGYTKTTEAARFSRTLGTLLRSGVPIIQGLELVRHILGNRIVANSMEQVVRGVRKGERLAKPLAATGVFPNLAIQMITVGEETGRLEEMLLRVAENYEKTLRNTIKRFISLLEPAMILAMALMVGFIVISMLMAIFSMNELPF